MKKPTVEKMISDLRRLGWKQLRITLWKSPSGEIYLGPYKAWTIATAEFNKGSQAQ